MKKNLFRIHNGFDALFATLYGNNEPFGSLWQSFCETLKCIICENKENAQQLSQKLPEFDILTRIQSMRSVNDFQIIVQGFLFVCFEGTISYQDGDFISESFVLQDVSLMSTMFHYLKQAPSEYFRITFAALKVIHTSLTSNIFNTALFAKTDCLETILNWIADSTVFLDGQLSVNSNSPIPKISYDEESAFGTILLFLAKETCSLGITAESLRIVISKILTDYNLSNSKKLFFMDLMLYTLKTSRHPGYFKFEPNYCSGRFMLEDFGRPFPPQTGYSIMGWINVLQFDSDSDIPILTIQDSQGESQLQIYLCKIFSGFAIRSKKSEIIIKNFPLPKNTWIHFALSHQKPMITSSTLDFYVNGKLLISTKYHYLGSFGSFNPTKTYFGSFGNSNHIDSTFQFCMGPICMIEDYLLDAQTAGIIYDIGYEYSGNWQGSWESYIVGNQALQIKTTQLNEEENHSPLINQIASFAVSPGRVSNDYTLSIPEESFLFSICAENEYQHLSLYSQQELKNSEIYATIKKFDQNVILNGAVPKLIENADSKCKLAKIEGRILSIKPLRFVDSMWTLGGCAIMLRLVEVSNTNKELNLALSILVKSVNCSWRSLGEMERGQMYDILVFILKAKSIIITVAELELIFSLVGKTSEGSK
jgi:hypothetical protein